MVRHDRALLGGRLGRADVHPRYTSIESTETISAPSAVGERDPGLGLADGGRADEREQRASGIPADRDGHGRRRRPELAVRWCARGLR